LRYATATGGDDHFIIWAPSTVLRVPVDEHWGVHAEYFGEFAQQAQTNFVRHFFSSGIHYLVTDNLEVGVRVGWGLNDQTSRLFTNVGFGWRF
jgi:Putative MetA-pathway of phenol degradation